MHEFAWKGLVWDGENLWKPSFLKMICVRELGSHVRSDPAQCKYGCDDVVIQYLQWEDLPQDVARKTLRSLKSQNEARTHKPGKTDLPILRKARP